MIRQSILALLSVAFGILIYSIKYSIIHYILITYRFRQLSRLSTLFQLIAEYKIDFFIY